MIESGLAARSVVAALLCCAVVGCAVSLVDIERYKDRRDVHNLMGALDNSDPGIRARAAQALGSVGDVRAVDPLIVALGDEEDSVRQEAAMALGMIRSRQAVDALVSSLRDSSAPVRKSAAWALGAIGDTRAVDPLIRALSDPDFGVRWEAVDALVLVGDERAIGPLATLLQAGDSQAAEALSKFGETAVPALIEVLVGGSTRSAGCAAAALGLMKKQAEAAIPFLIEIFPTDPREEITVIETFSIPDQKVIVEVPTNLYGGGPTIKVPVDAHSTGYTSQKVEAGAAAAALYRITGTYYETQQEWQAWWARARDRYTGRE